MGFLGSAFHYAALLNGAAFSRVNPKEAYTRSEVPGSLAVPDTLIAFTSMLSKYVVKIFSPEIL